MKLNTLLKIYVLLQSVLGASFVPLVPQNLRHGAFFDQFDYASLAESGWVVSKGQKSDGSSYSGQWAIEESRVYPGLEGDKGLVMKTEAAFYAISKKLPELVDVAQGDLVVQFEVKFQSGVSCAGAYVKLINDLGDPKQFSDETPFEIMFGPDICGSNSKVVLHVRTGEGAEKVESRIRNLPMARSNPLTNLYTLVLRKNYDVEIRINGEVAKAGNLFTPHFMAPPLDTPEFIEDSNAQKPSDWDERRYIIDEEATKPEGWDEAEGARWIPDPNVHKPAGWNDDESEPELIPDAGAQKPKEWDEEEDGEWKAPLVRNPACLYGCGRWEAPKIANPDYRGAWYPPQILNPNYQGTWKPPKVKNPRFSSDKRLKWSPVEALGFEVWSMDSGILIDNLYVGQLVGEAENIGNSTFLSKSEAEYEDYKINKPKPKHDARKPPKSFDEILDEEDVSHLQLIVNYFRALAVYRYNDALEYWAMFEANPLIAISSHPFKFSCFCFVGLFVLTLVLGTINLVALLYMVGQAEVAPQKKIEEPELTEEEMIAKITSQASGAQKSETTATRRA